MVGDSGSHRMAETHGNDGRYGGPGAFFNSDLRLIESGRGHQAHEWLDDAPRPRQCRQIRAGCPAVVIFGDMHVHDVPRAGQFRANNSRTQHRERRLAAHVQGAVGAAELHARDGIEVCV